MKTMILVGAVILGAAQLGRWFNGVVMQTSHNVEVVMGNVARGGK